MAEPRTEYPLMEAFYTIQGEGRFSGYAAYFIRLAGCDVGCVWCDVKESWDAHNYPVKSATELAAMASAVPAPLVVVTGGEPCMYDLGPLCDALHKAGKRVHLETSGAYPIRGTFDWICVSPKKFKEPLPNSIGRAHEFKVIAYNKSDLHWAMSWEKLLPESCLLLLQPEWSRQEKMASAITDFIKANPNWKMSIQSHKYLGIP